MLDFFARSRTQPQPQALHFSYEKSGLVIENQRIPWNAEAVLVEALVRLPAQASRTREDFTLRLAGDDRVHHAEAIAVEQSGAPCRAYFRLPPPAHTVAAELLWRGKSLGQLSLPVLTLEDFLQHLSLQHASLNIDLGGETLPGLTYVTTQCENLLASALLVSATSLVALQDLDLRVHVLTDDAQEVHAVPVRLSSSQMRARQALVTVALPRLRKRGLWKVAWMLQNQVLAVHALRTITQATFARSLRLSATRFIVQDATGSLRVTPILPELKSIDRLGPCFWVSSSEPAVAGYCELEIRARLLSADRTESLGKHRVVISDGPEPVAAGTLAAVDLDDIRHFELLHHKSVLGILPLSGAPTAHFNAEGAFSPAENFPWSPSSDVQLAEKMALLMKRT